MHWVWKYAGVALNPPPPDAAAAAGIDFSSLASEINTQTHYNLNKTIKHDMRLGWNTEPPSLTPQPPPPMLNVVTACRLLLFNIACRHTFPRHHRWLTQILASEVTCHQANVWKVSSSPPHTHPSISLCGACTLIVTAFCFCAARDVK